MLMTSFCVAAGGGLGALCRFWLNLLLTARLGSAMPFGTILINVTGSFAIGLIGAMTEAGGRFPLSADLRLFLLVGLCGGYTTFSSFSLQTMTLFQTGQGARAALNVVVSLLFCLVAVWAGLNAPHLVARLVRR